MNWDSCQNWVQNIFCSTSTLLEQPLLLYIIVTGVWSECNIFVCYLCTGNWCIFIMFVMCENTDNTSYYVIPADGHIVVSVCCTLHVIKSEGMQQLMYNCAHFADICWVGGLVAGAVSDWMFVINWCQGGEAFCNHKKPDRVLYQCWS